MYAEILRLLIKRAALLLLLLFALTSSQSAWAANPSDEGCNQDDECRGHFVQGLSLYKQQDYSSALKEFQTAYDRRQTPILLANIGRTLQKLGRPKEALDYYLRCKEAAKTDTDLQEKLSVYISETKALLSSSSPTVTPPEPQQEPVPAPLSQPLPQEPKKKPVYKKGWFIATVVVGAVVVAGAVTVGVILGTRPQPDPPLDPSVVVIRPMF